MASHLIWSGSWVWQAGCGYKGWKWWHFSSSVITQCDWFHFALISDLFFLSETPGRGRLGCCKYSSFNSATAWRYNKHWIRRYSHTALCNSCFLRLLRHNLTFTVIEYLKVLWPYEAWVKIHHLKKLNREAVRSTETFFFSSPIKGVAGRIKIIIFFLWFF